MALGSSTRATTDTGTVDQSAKELVEFADQIKARLVRIKGQVNNLCLTYKGKGAMAFQECMGDWDLTTEKVRQSIIDLGADTKSAGGTTAQGDAQSAHNIQSAAQKTYFR
jgi:WXG100 family type VII secretion target